MGAQPGFCQATVFMPIIGEQLEFPTANGSNFSFTVFSPVQQLANFIAGAGLTLASQIQALIDADATYIAFKALHPGTNITISAFDATGLTSIITIPIDVTATQAAVMCSGTGGDDLVTGFFVCTPKRKRSVAGFCPRYIDVIIQGIAPAQIIYKNCGIYENPVSKGNNIYTYTKKIIL